MRVSNYDTAELERELGPRGALFVNSGNRDKVQNWLLSQGFPSVWVKRARVATLAKTYNVPAYLAWCDANRDKLASGADTGTVDEPVNERDVNQFTLGASPLPLPEPIAVALPDSVPVPASGAASTIEQAIRAIVSATTPALDEARVIALIREHAARPEIRRIVVEDTRGEVRDCGLQHVEFEKLLKACSARDAAGNRLNVWLSGPAGSGKTTAAESVAKALGLRFAFNGAIDTEYKLLGFTDAQGRLVSRPFRDVYENGGVYLFDEIDRSLPGALLAFNAALANGVCDFPDGTVKRHPDCVIIAAANTYGLGGGADVYVGAMKQDAALLDRFAYIKFPVDEALERATCPDSAWCDYVQSVRAKVARQGLKVIVSPRASYQGASLLAAGLDRETVIAMTLRKGLSDEQWGAVA